MLFARGNVCTFVSDVKMEKSNSQNRIIGQVPKNEIRIRPGQIVRPSGKKKKKKKN